MELGHALNLSQIGILCIIMWKLLWKNTDKTDALVKDVAVLEILSKDSKADHDELIRLKAKYEEMEKDLNAAHAKLRSIQ